MTRIAISAPTFDLTSPVELDILPESALQEISRRVSRSKTLDLGVSITDNGFCHGDRTLKIQARVTEEVAAALLYLAQTYSLLTIALPEGVFSGVIESAVNDGGKISLTILVSEKLSGE
jgi:hypothetical protein